MTEKKPPEHGDEPRSEDLELDDNHAKDVAGGDKAASGHVQLHDLSFTKYCRQGVALAHRVGRKSSAVRPVVVARTCYTTKGGGT